MRRANTGQRNGELSAWNGWMGYVTRVKARRAIKRTTNRIDRRGARRAIDEQR